MLALLSGCTSTYRASQSEQPVTSAAQPPGATTNKNVWSHVFFFGFVRSVKTDVRAVCPSGTAESFRLGATPLTTAVSIITLGLYTPIEQSYACVPPPPTAGNPQ
jgi:hypothetical protein